MMKNHEESVYTIVFNETECDQYNVAKFIKITRNL
jgi:hypothetical protein